VDLRSGHKVLQEPQPPKSRRKRRASKNPQPTQSTSQESVGSSGGESPKVYEPRIRESHKPQSSDLIDLTSPSEPNQESSVSGQYSIDNSGTRPEVQKAKEHHDQQLGS